MTCSTFMLILLRRLQFHCKQFRTSGPWLRVTTGSNLKGVWNTNIYTQSLQPVSGIGAASANSIVSRSKKLIVITKTNCTAICMWVSHCSQVNKANYIHDTYPFIDYCISHFLLRFVAQRPRHNIQSATNHIMNFPISFTFNHKTFSTLFLNKIPRSFSHYFFCNLIVVRGRVQ